MDMTFEVAVIPVSEAGCAAPVLARAVLAQAGSAEAVAS